MGVVHDALRRDLVRLQSALGSAPPPDGNRRVAIADHARWMMDFLHHHHQAEDTGLWPLIRQRAPQAQGLLDRMEADHAHVTSAAERLRQTAARYRSDAGDQPRADFRDAVSGLSQALLPHLRGEEDEAMPLVAAVLTEAEWRHWDQANNVKGKSLGRLAADGHWLMDGLDPARYTTLIHLVPAPVRIVIIKGYARRYRAECARRWGPGIAVGPVATAPPTDGGPHPRSAETSVRKRFTPVSYLTPWRIR